MAKRAKVDYNSLKSIRVVSDKINNMDVFTIGVNYGGGTPKRKRINKIGPGELFYFDDQDVSDEVWEVETMGVGVLNCIDSEGNLESWERSDSWVIPCDRGKNPITYNASNYYSIPQNSFARAWYGCGNTTRMFKLQDIDRLIEALEHHRDLYRK